jgi:site-specific recombinase XerC
MTSTIDPAVFQLSSLTQQRIQGALDAAWADSTLRKYRSAIRAFLAFCDLKNVPLTACCLASEVLLCVFASSRMGALAGDSVRNQMSALKAWQTYLNVPWRGS